MDTMNINAELFRQLSYIADDETYMKKALVSIRKLVSQKRKAAGEMDAYQPKTKEEVLADFNDACYELKQNQKGELAFKPLDEVLNEL
jgi:hypothetical protein